MKKSFRNGAALLGAVTALSLMVFAGCPTEGTDGTENSGKTTTAADPVGLASVTINGQAVDIGFRGTQGFAGGEGWGYFSNGAQNGGIYSVANAADLASVTVAATPTDSGATVKYAFVQYTPRSTATDSEYSSPGDDAYSTSGVLTGLSDMDYIAVEVSKGADKAWYKFRVAVEAPLLGEDGVSAGTDKLGWTIPDMFKATDDFWTHRQGAYFHANVGPTYEQSIGLVLQDTLSLEGKTLSVDVPSGATATWAIGNTEPPPAGGFGDATIGIALPAAGDWKALSEALPATIASASLLSVRVQNTDKTLYYNWWVYKKPDIKLNALSIAGNVVDSAKLIAFADTWSGAVIQEIIVPVEDPGAVLESAKIAWAEPLGMGLAIAVTTGGQPASDNWQGTSRGQNDNLQVVVQPPAVDLHHNDILSIRARISDKVWYYRAKIVFRSLQTSDSDLTGLTIGSGQTATQVTDFGTAGDSVANAAAGQALNLSLSQATNAAITPAGGPNARFLYAKGNGTVTPSTGWINTGTLSFDTGDYLIIQAFTADNDLPSQFYKFLVTVTYPAADDVKLASLSIGSITIAEGSWGTPDVQGGATGSSGTAALTLAQKSGASLNGTVPAAAAGSTIKFAKVAAAGAEPTGDDWQEIISVPNQWGPPTITYPSFDFADSGDTLWIRVAAGTQIVKTYKLAVTVSYPSADDVVLASLSIGGGAIAISDWGTPWVDQTTGSQGAATILTARNGGVVTGTVPVAAAGSTIKFAKVAAPGTAEPAAGAWKEGAEAQFTFAASNNDVLWIRVAAGTQTVKTYRITITLRDWAETDAALDSLSITGDMSYDFGTGGFTIGYIVNVADFGTPNAAIGSAVGGAFTVDGTKNTGLGTPGLYVNAIAGSGAAIEFAKTTGAAPAADATWSAVTIGAAPPAFVFANNDVLWAKVTAGTFVKYYKFAVTVTTP